MLFEGCCVGGRLVPGGFFFSFFFAVLIYEFTRDDGYAMI